MKRISCATWMLLLLVAFSSLQTRARSHRGHPTPTPTPIPTPTPTPTPIPTPTPTPIPAPSPTPTPRQVSLAWNQDPDSSTIGYMLYYTSAPGLLTSGGNVPPSGTALQSNYPGIGSTTAIVAHLNSGQTYYFGVAAYNASNQMSLLSNVVTAVAP